MFKQFFRKGINLVDARNRPLGRIPPPVARALVTSNHATLLRDNPAIIGLQSHVKVRTAHDKHTANSPLKQLIATATVFVTKNSHISAMNSIMFQIANNRLYVSVANLDVFFKGCITSDNKHTFSHDKDVSGICINTFQIKKILSCNDETATIHIKGGDSPGLQIGSFFIEGFLPDEKLSNMPFKEGDKTSSFTVTNIAQKLSFVGRAVSDSKYKAALSGIYFDTARQQLAGADGNRLHVVAMNEPGKTRSDKNAVEGVIVPASVLKVARLLTGVGRIIEGSDAGQGPYQYVNFALSVPGCGDCTATFQTVDGQFPKYEDVIPREFASRFTARPQDILSILHKALIASATDSDSKPITAEFRHGQMTVTVNVRGRTTYRGAVQGQYNGAPYCGVVNVIFVLDAIQTSGDSVEILLQSEKDKAWTIKGKTGCAVVMPIETE